MKKKKPNSTGRTKKGAMGSAYELLDAARLIGCVKGAPKDLSTNKKYFAGFGESKPGRSRGA